MRPYVIRFGDIELGRFAALAKQIINQLISSTYGNEQLLDLMVPDLAFRSSTIH
jgi:hypothetical protein